EKGPVSEWVDVLREKPAMEAICRAVAKVSKVDLKSIVDGHNSRLRKNQPRKLAMYLCQILSDEKLANIAEYFGLKSVGSVCPAISEMKKLEEKGEMSKVLNQVYRILNIKK
ncbi:helix-turn-helix domain-containing protein, partial [Pleionea mediterranea]